MTLKDLSQLYYLKREIKMDEGRLRELESKVLPGVQRFTGMPHTPGVRDKVGSYAEKADKLREIVEKKHQRCINERNRLEQYISGIEDSLVRQIFTYRFVEGLTWSAVAVRVGGGNTANSVRMICKRFLRKS